MSEALATSRKNFLLYETEDGISGLSVCIEVDRHPLPNGPSPVARKKGGNDAA